MSPVSDIAKFAILQAALICFVLLLFDILALIDAILFYELDFPKTVTILAISRGSEMVAVAAFYSVISGAFHHRFTNLRVWLKEVTSLTVLVTASTIHHSFYEPLDFKFVLTGMQVIDFVALYAALYLFIRLVLIFAVWIESKKTPDGD